MTCANVSNLTLPNTTIISATETTSTTGNYCNVIGVIDKRVSEQDPDHFTYGIGFELNLPDSWVGRFEMMGGGGTDGSVSSPMGSAGTELSMGWAVAADDGGHEDAPGNPAFGWIDDDANAGGSAHFGVDEEARTDYGYNGIRKTTEISKAIIAQYYGQGPQFLVSVGSSNGGRDATVAAQRDPDMFDGLVSGNPGFDLPRAAVTEAWNEQKLAPLATSLDSNGQPYLPPTFPPQDLEVASAAILSACDALDGLVDGIIDNYTACTNQRVYPALDAFTCSHRREWKHAAWRDLFDRGAGDSAEADLCRPAEFARRPVVHRLVLGCGNLGSAVGVWTGLGGMERIVLWAAEYNTALNLTLGGGAVPMVFTTPPVVTPVAGTNGQEAFIFSYNFDTDAPKIYETSRGYPESSIDFMTGTPFGPSPFLYQFKNHGGKIFSMTR